MDTKHPRLGYKRAESEVYQEVEPDTSILVNCQSVSTEAKQAIDHPNLALIVSFFFDVVITVHITKSNYLV
jgi:hypothetical protein